MFGDRLQVADERSAWESVRSAWKEISTVVALHESRQLQCAVDNGQAWLDMLYGRVSQGGNNDTRSGWQSKLVRFT